MKSKTKTPANPIQTTTRSARGFLKKEIELTAADTMSIVVEPLLEAIGWNMKDPQQVRRQDSAIKLTHPSASEITIFVSPLQQDLAKSAARQAKTTQGWIVMTNGLQWSIFNSNKPKDVFRSVDFTPTPVAKSQQEIFQLLSRDAVTAKSLESEWSSESIDDNVAEALRTLVKGSDALLAEMQDVLAQTGAQYAKEDLKASVERIYISISASDPAVGKSEADEVQVAPTKKAIPKAAEKVTAASKKAVNKVTSAAAPSANASDKSDAQDWPASATHCMKRKKNIAYIKMSARTHKSTLLPGSVITATEGKTLSPQMKDMRKVAIDEGKLESDGDLLKVVAPIDFDDPRMAATFAAGTFVKDISAWLNKRGTPLDNAILATRKSTKNSAPKATSKKSAAQPQGDTKAEDAEPVLIEPVAEPAKPREKLTLNFKKSPRSDEASATEIASLPATEEDIPPATV